MANLNLFAKENIVGIFRGFSEGGLEFHADLVLPYRNEFQSMPMHGQFVLVQLATDEEAVLGRVTSLAAEGRLTSGAGEDYGVRAMRGEREIPDDLREDYLKYRVNIRVLGVIRKVNGRIIFAASHRRLPHVGSKVAWPGPDVLKEIVGHNDPGAEIGFYALGEYVFAEGDDRLKRNPDQHAWMQVQSPSIMPRFPIDNLVSRRSYIFARAGFGKSNLTKLLFSSLYKGNPSVHKRRGDTPVGTVIFDVDGEYFWPDDKGRAALCDVPELKDKVVVFSEKQGPSGFYGSFLAGDIRLDIRRLPPADVITIALSNEQQNQQNVRKLRGLSQERWEELVNLVDQDKADTDPEEIKRILRLGDDADAEAAAAKSNMNYVIKLLHSRSSQLLDMLMEALRDGKLCVVDVSRLRGRAALVLSGLILKRIFSHNQEEFTKAEPKTIPTIAVLEEAQAVLGRSDETGENPYVAWVKEGRKYDLGAVLITQQPGSISTEILSQGDNWFVFHLLSAVDLQNLKKANAHFSDDLLSALLNEPLHGQGVFWSSASMKQYPIQIRALSFDQNVAVHDPTYSKPPIETYASALRVKYHKRLAELVKSAVRTAPTTSTTVVGPKQAVIEVTTPQNLAAMEGEGEPDVLELIRNKAIQEVAESDTFRQRFEKGGLTWRGVKEELLQHLPQHLENRDKLAYDLVRPALDKIFGPNGWDKQYKPSKTDPAKQTLWVFKVPVNAQ